MAHFFTVFIIVYAVVYSLVHGSLFVGLLGERARERRLLRAGREVPAVLVSVIVPVRNEEALLPLLLSGLKSQTWPDIEYFFVDDGSTDSSVALLEAFKRECRFPVCILKAEEPAGGGGFVNRKQQAMGRAIAEARGSILLFTDADCAVGPDWAGSMARYMSADGTGVVLGPVYKRSAVRGMLYDYQGFDQVVRGMYVAASAGLGAAGGGFGNNIAVRKKALEEAGGYASIPPTITEDAAMISLIRKKTRYTVHAVYDAAVHVHTRCEPTWGKLVNQTLRWHHGGLFSADAVTSLSFGALALFYFICALCFPLALIYPPLLIIPAVVFIENVALNLPAKMYAGKSLPLKLPQFILYAFIIEYFFTLLTVLCFTAKKPEWKR
ncbi:MAG: glycosyltransferase [Spirochaetaceae bacterium]|nr:glycosyltransferase [Spirochaetaceae bacterium]